MKGLAFPLTGMVLISSASGLGLPRPQTDSCSPLLPPNALSSPLASSSSSSTCLLSTYNTDADNNDAPPLTRTPPRKVCLMVEPTPFTHVSGYSNRFSEMLRYMRKAGDDVEILTVDSQTKEEDLPREKYGYNIEHTQGFTFPLYNRISLTLDLPELKGASILEKMKPDLIHVSAPGFMVYAAIFYARVMRIPLLMSYHTHLPSYAISYLGFIPGIVDFAWFINRFVHSKADLTLCTSPQLQAELTANGVPRVEVWRKGIDTIRFDPKFRDRDMRSKMSGGRPDDFLLVYVGRLGSEKRLMDIKPMLEQLGEGVTLCIVGGGPQAEELEEYFEGTPTVFMGQRSGDELSQIFASADVFVMPSDSETLGFVVLESMASGVPVVGARAGGIPNLIKDEENGYLVTPGDTDGFVEKIRMLRENKDGIRERIGVKAREEAERWGWEAATSVLRNIQYEKAIVNFHSRAFGGFGRPGSQGLLRLLKWRIRRVLSKLGFTS